MSDFANGGIVHNYTGTRDDEIPYQLQGPCYILTKENTARMRAVLRKINTTDLDYLWLPRD